ncbi:MAG TPA: HofP DNA utilization family protein [Scandinavium sp.]|jgi:pilus assembly protein HofP|uniref:HofP DNA utilization family protein n=1 Tax=Scandinavium sp. TaxID=2830653 RepID=UPI002E302681|nr:HofP DNA utilization family protein [Scandinavium sp.]HEX4503580.1 HofP DNA utilization family protein [Scandinavium sp.]
MSNRLALAVILLSLPWLVGLRDPFLPPVDRCAASQITIWHYRGMVSSGQLRVGMVVDAGGKWQRLAQGQRLENGWQVTGVEPEHMDMAAGVDCEPSQWRWLKEGTKNDSKSASGVTADGSHDLGKRQKSNANGR